MTIFVYVQHPIQIRCQTSQLSISSIYVVQRSHLRSARLASKHLLWLMNYYGGDWERPENRYQSGEKKAGLRPPLS